MIISSCKVATIGLGLGRVDYWRFLCHVYGMGALEAWNRIKRQGLPPSVQDIRNAVNARRIK